MLADARTAPQVNAVLGRRVRGGSTGYRLASIMVLLLAATTACARPTATGPDRKTMVECQAAAAEFLMRELRGAKAACLRFAAGPGEMVEGMVGGSLADPPQALVEQVRARGTSSIRAFSSCSPTEREAGDGAVVLTLGWPTVVSDGVEVPADRLCGWGCDRGFRVHVSKTDQGWVAIGAYATWVS